jgi:short-subunit dehydrogenase involved in D-alanine esterification of teichoic acids
MLNEKCTIVLTGGTSGIGEALLEQLCAAGHTVVVLARNEDKLASLARQHRGLVTRVCDLSRRESIESVMPALLEEHPDISVLINNAGMQVEGKITDPDFSLDNVATETATNFMAPIWLIYSMLDHLRRQQTAAIVNVSSGLAIYPKTGSAVYSATKAALHSFTQSLRYQLEDTGVHVFEAIVPMVDTPMTAGRGSGKISAQECAKQMIAGIHANRDEIYIGKARLLPLLSRLAPGTAKRILKNAG